MPARTHRLPYPATDEVPQRRYRWYHAAAVGLLANAVSILPAGINGDEAFYNDLTTPAGSPPDWLFPPAWAFNNVTTLWANLRVANLPTGTPGRRTALLLEAGSWTAFAIFNTVYFGLRSPGLGAAVTVGGFALTAASFAATWRLDRGAALAIAPRLAWLGYATYVAVGTAVLNPDPVLGW